MSVILVVPVLAYVCNPSAVPQCHTRSRTVALDTSDSYHSIKEPCLMA